MSFLCSPSSAVFVFILKYLAKKRESVAIFINLTVMLFMNPSKAHKLEKVSASRFINHCCCCSAASKTENVMYWKFLFLLINMLYATKWMCLMLWKDFDGMESRATTGTVQVEENFQFLEFLRIFWLLFLAKAGTSQVFTWIISTYLISYSPLYILL